MRKSEVFQKDVTLVVKVTCNKCGVECTSGIADEQGNIGCEEGVHIKHSGGFNAEYFQDGDVVEFDICEKCLYAFTKTFKISPKLGNYMGDAVEDPGETVDAAIVVNATELKLEENLRKLQKSYEGTLTLFHTVNDALLIAEGALSVAKLAGLMRPGAIGPNTISALKLTSEEALKVITPLIEKYGRPSPRDRVPQDGLKEE